MSNPAPQQYTIDILERSIQREKAARKLAEQLLEDKSRDLYLSNQVMEKSLKNLKEAQSQLVQSEKMASVGQLAAGIAHEINNPVGFIASNLGTLAEYIDDLKTIIQLQQDLINSLTPGKKTLEDLENLSKEIDIDFILGDIDSLVSESNEGAQRVKKIVSDLAEFSHINSAEIAREDINNLLEKTLNLARNQLKYEVEVSCDFGDLPHIECNGGKLGQVFLNLIINAAHAMEENSSDRILKISTQQCSIGIQVSIEDNGVGIDAKKIARIFDPFYTTKEVGKGTGLGLHIVQDVINSHGGTIQVKSKPGTGTNFIINLPCSGQLTEGQKS